MGSIEIARLIEAVQALDVSRGLFGSAPRMVPMSAIRILAPRGKELVFGGETKMIAADVPREETYPQSLGQERPHRWIRFEVYVPSTGSGVKPGHHLFIADHPTSSGVFHSITFRSKAGNRRPTFPEGGFASAEHFVNWIEDQTCDYWEKGKYYVAGFSKWGERLVMPNQLRSRHKNAERAFGSCHLSVGELEKWLLDSDAVKKLLRDTRNRRLDISPRGIPLKERPQLNEEVIGESYVLMLASIRQALAGPLSDMESMEGRPVTDWVKCLYLDHLYDRYKVVKARSNKEQSVDEPEDWDD